MEKLNLRQLRAIAKNHQMKNYFKIRKSKLIELLSDVEIKSMPDLPAHAYNCPHGKFKYCKECDGSQICEHKKKIIFVKNVVGREYANMEDRRVLVKSVMGVKMEKLNIIVKNVVVLRFVNMEDRRVFVKNVPVLRYAHTENRKVFKKNENMEKNNEFVDC